MRIVLRLNLMPNDAFEEQGSIASTMERAHLSTQELHGITPEIPGLITYGATKCWSSPFIPVGLSFNYNTTCYTNMIYNDLHGFCTYLSKYRCHHLLSNSHADVHPHCISCLHYNISWYYTYVYCMCIYILYMLLTPGACWWDENVLRSQSSQLQRRTNRFWVHLGCTVSAFGHGFVS